MRPFFIRGGEDARLGDVGLPAFGNVNGFGEAGMDGHVGASEAVADAAGQRGTGGHVTADGGDAEQFAGGFAEQPGKTDRVVDVGADVGVEDEFCFHDR